MSASSCPKLKPQTDRGQYDQLIRDAITLWSATYHVPVPFALVKRIIGEESRFDPRACAIEPGGELSRGLMQVKHSTARDLGLTEPQLLYVPAVAIRYGVKYLASKLARYRGDLASAVAAYNAGSARRTGPGGPFVNQQYVDRVLRGWRPIAIGAGALAGIAALTLLLLRRVRARA